MSDRAEDWKPSEANFESWPLWACVAFAARCSRRVQPLFHSSWPSAPPRYIDDLDDAIGLSEAANTTTAQYVAAYEAVENAHAAARTAGAKISAFAAYTAYATANAAAATSGRRAEIRVSRATSEAVSAACAAGPTAVHAIFSDYVLVLRSIERNEIGVTDTVPPSFFGPMWPDGVPKEWPPVDPVSGRKLEGHVEADEAGDPVKTSGKEYSTKPKELILELDFPADATDRQIEDAIAELTVHLNKVHVAHGGDGLVIADMQVFDAVREGVEV